MTNQMNTQPKEYKFIKYVVKAPYICKVPCGGLRAIKCYPDAITCFIRGITIGYSEREKTMIVPLDIDTDHINMCKQILQEQLQKRNTK